MKKSNFILLLGFLGSILQAQEWNPDLSGTKAYLERFFYDDRENKTNLQRIHYDQENRIIMSAFLKEDGSERSRKTYRYQDGDLVEYSIWDKRGDGWHRWYHVLTETSIHQDEIHIIKTSYRYKEPGVVTLRKITDLDHNLITVEHQGYDGSHDYQEYNGEGLISRRTYAHEKSGGEVTETYSYEYAGELPVVRVVDDGQRQSKVLMEYDDDQLLVKEIFLTEDDEISTEVSYEYQNGLLTSSKTFQEGKLVFESYAKYDETGLKVKWGESAQYDSYAYERYWILEPLE